MVVFIVCFKLVQLDRQTQPGAIGVSNAVCYRTGVKSPPSPNYKDRGHSEQNGVRSLGV